MQTFTVDQLSPSAKKVAMDDHRERLAGYFIALLRAYTRKKLSDAGWLSRSVGFSCCAATLRKDGISFTAVLRHNTLASFASGALRDAIVRHEIDAEVEIERCSSESAEVAYYSKTKELDKAVLEGLTELLQPLKEKAASLSKSIGEGSAEEMDYQKGNEIILKDINAENFLFTINGKLADKEDA